MNKSLKHALLRGPLFWAGCLILIAMAGIGVWRLSGARGDRTDANLAPGSRDFTIFLLGGSTAFGEPYAPRADFGRIVSRLWDGRFNGRPIRVVNLGEPGKPARDAIAHARRISRTRFEAGTAVAFLYLGNNEFLRLDGRPDLRAQGRPLFDQPTVTPAEKEQVFRDYAATIEEIIDTLEAAGIGVIVSTIAVNMKDWEPNRSVLHDPADGPAVKGLLLDGDRKLEAGQTEAALKDYLRILELEPAFALAWKKAGDCHRLSGRFDDARTCYQKAVDEDGSPYREISEQTRILREICARRRVPVVDAVKILESATTDGLLGFEFLWDNCHPTLEGYARIARGFAETMREMFGEQRRPAEIDMTALERALRIDRSFTREVIAGRGQYCYMMATMTWNPSERLKRGELYLKQAMEMGPRDAGILCSLAILTALQGRAESSLATWREAYRLDPKTTLQRAGHPFVREILRRDGIEDLPAMIR
ncbi:MAG: hypothetical protein PHU25_10370 [Deltaproteobacteria bacterium]|nr:hypothetical protein [Deltaproteobacteria bacterium]